VSSFCDNSRLRDFWYVAATELELSAGAVGRTVLGERLVLYRDPVGRVVCAPDRCPHREAPLSAGTLRGGVLSCAYHGWSYGEQGRCVRIPSADPDFPIPANAHLPRVHAIARYGLVWVCLGDGSAELPNISQDDDPAFRRLNNPMEPWKASAARMTDNFLDIAHFPWVHSGTFGSSQRLRVPDIDLESLDDDFYGYRYQVVAENPPAAILVTGQSGTTVVRQMSTGYRLPFVVRSTVLYETGLLHVILLLSTPIDDLNSYFTFVVWRNDDFSVSAEDVLAFDRKIGAEDKAMLERIPGLLPLSPRALASTGSDKPSTAWRHQFARLLAGAAEPGAIAGAQGA
jgi:phenylpropionate dioxygenase-like ring-hydroxylating dioxygenase large terminal subunit